MCLILDAISTSAKRTWKKFGLVSFAFVRPLFFNLFIIHYVTTVLFVMHIKNNTADGLSIIKITKIKYKIK